MHIVEGPVRGPSAVWSTRVTLGEGSEDTRRVVERHELKLETWTLALHLANEENRLVVMNSVAPGRETVEVAHEALIRNWPTLINWVNQDGVFQAWLRQLRSRIGEWLLRLDDEGTLLRGGPLEQALDWRQRRPDERSDQESAYIDASLGWSAETERAARRRMQEVEEIIKAHKSDLARRIANDFNDVLSTIMMATDFLLNAHKPTDPSFQDIMQIKQNANRAARVVRQLLAFSRRQTLRAQVLDLGEVLSDLAILLRRLIGENVTLEVVHERDLWSIKADISQFEQVIVNIAVNARDAMPGGGKLVVRTSNVSDTDCARFLDKPMTPGDYVLVEVSDTGSGIPPAIIDKIFEPFFSTKEVGKGAGLGLATVYGIVKQTDGFIFPESEVGVGIRFSVLLPRYIPTQEDEDATEAEVNRQLEAAGAGKTAKPVSDLEGRGTVLLVDGEEELRRLNARALALCGYTVVTASNVVEAFNVLERRAPPIHLVISDVPTREMDGPAVLKALRDRDSTLKIIFLSGYCDGVQADSGQRGFLAKPFTVKQLLTVVKETLYS
jgi:two-component system, cell cycle sensor histidine kinase and response regulator CckA